MATDVEIKKLMDEGKEAFQARNLSLAEKSFMSIVELTDKNSDAFFYLGNIFHQKGQIGKAIKAFNRVLELNPQNTDAGISLSILYNDIGEYEKASVIFEKANDNVKKATSDKLFEDPHINKKFAQKHFELAELYSSYHRFDEALFEYKKASSLEPDRLETRLKIAKTLAKKGFNSKAIEELNKLKNENPSYSPARIALGLIYFAGGNVIEAENEWNKVLARDPGNDEAKNYLNLSKTATETSFSSGANTNREAPLH